MGYDISAVKGFGGGGRDLDKWYYELSENWLTTECDCTPIKTWQTLLHQIKQFDELPLAAEEIEQQLAEQMKQHLLCDK